MGCTTARNGITLTTVMHKRTIVPIASWEGGSEGSPKCHL